MRQVEGLAMIPSAYKHTLPVYLLTRLPAYVLPRLPA